MKWRESRRNKNIKRLKLCDTAMADKSNSSVWTLLIWALWNVIYKYYKSWILQNVGLLHPLPHNFILIYRRCHCQLSTVMHGHVRLPTFLLLSTSTCVKRRFQKLLFIFYPLLSVFCEYLILLICRLLNSKFQIWIQFDL